MFKLLIFACQHALSAASARIVITQEQCLVFLPSKGDYLHEWVQNFSRLFYTISPGRCSDDLWDLGLKTENCEKQVSEDTCKLRFLMKFRGIWTVLRSRNYYNLSRFAWGVSQLWEEVKFDRVWSPCAIRVARRSHTSSVSTTKFRGAENSTHSRHIGKNEKITVSQLELAIPGSLPHF